MTIVPVKNSDERKKELDDYNLKSENNPKPKSL